LVPLPFALALLAYTAQGPSLWLSLTLVVGLLIFGFVFAINSSVHSYLILAFAGDKRVTMDVGFYYMANAAGRLYGLPMNGQWITVGTPDAMPPAEAIVSKYYLRP
jgi:NDP-sugar pyrophosphorylase family protein